jgi:Ca2+-binding EF-hand superfamily protein
MAPVTRERGNRFAHSEDGNDREEPVREESPAAYQAHSEAQFASLREQIAVLTRQLSIKNVQDRRRHIPSPHDSEEEDARVENEYGNPFAERGVHRHQPLVQAQANRWESGFKLDTPEFQSCMQPKEFMVAEKNNKNIPPKEVPRKMAKMVPKEGAEIKHQSVSRYIGGTCQQFQRTCILGGKVAKLIIDPRSGMNIVSEEAVRKLGLETKSHPSPYQLEWLTNGNEVRVSKYCQVPFSIGAKYMDHVWCDVVDMTMCHLLLGKPWQDDKTAVYNETKNTYSFLLGKTKLTLLQSPWPEPQPSQENTESVDEECQESKVIDEEFERECVEDVDPSQGFVDWDSPPTYDDDINEKDPIEKPLAFALEEEHEELGKQMDEVNLSESFALFDNNSTYYVPVKSLEGKVFDFSVEPIDYIDFIGIDVILSNYSSQNYDEIYMVEEAFLSKIERLFVSSLRIRMACGKSKAREKHNKSTQKRGVWGFHNNHQDTPLMKITMIIMGRGLTVKLRRDDWNELTGHPKDRGRDRPNSRTNSLQPGEDDVD